MVSGYDKPSFNAQEGRNAQTSSILTYNAKPFLPRKCAPSMDPKNMFLKVRHATDTLCTDPDFSCRSLKYSNLYEYSLGSRTTILHSYVKSPFQMISSNESRDRRPMCRASWVGSFFEMSRE